VTSSAHPDARLLESSTQTQGSTQASAPKETDRLAANALSMTADVVSVVGFFISIYTLIQVRSVKASLIARLRLPQLIKSLIAHASALSKLYKEHDTNLEQVEIVMTQCSADLGNLIPKLAGTSKKDSIILREKFPTGGKRQPEKTRLRPGIYIPVSFN
jgi:hypothetical protein